MTQSVRRSWDDDRLNAAFAARAAASRKAPDDIVAAVIDAAGRRPRERAGGWRRSSLAAAAAIAIVVGIGGLAAVSVLTRPGAAAIPSAAASELTPLGLQIRTVAEAAHIRDAGADDQEIAVRGLFKQLPGPPGTPGGSCPPTLRMPVNPTLPQRCGATEQRIVDDPQAAGAAIRPLFGMLDRTVLMSAVSGNRAADVVVLGHFDDRRSVMCGADETECRDTFLVDRIVSVDGVVLASSTGLSLERLEPGKVQPKWTAADVDRLVASAAPAMTIASRLAIPGERIFEIEPALGTGSHGIIDRQLVWIVNGLEPRPGQPPRVRTFILVDNDPTTAFESVPYTTSNTGFAPVPLPAASQPPSTDDPFASAPPSAFGIGVGSIATTLQLHPQRDSAEIAIRGWYVPPDPAADCPLLHDPIRAVEMPCNQGRHWLLAEPEQLWADPTKVDIDRQPSGLYVNPIVPFDVAIDVPDTWADGSPEPWPVVLLGHFADPRPRTRSGRAAFTVDALVWKRGDASIDPDPVPAEIRFQPATETAAAVRDRFVATLGPDVVSWLTAVSGAQLQVVDPDVEPGRTDLADAPAVWVARRLVDERDGNVVRRVVTTAFTVDGSDRIWERRGCCSLKLVSLIGVARSAGDPSLVIEDQLDQVASATFDAPPLLTWRTIGPPEVPGLTIDVAATASDRQLAIRWQPPICGNTIRLVVSAELWVGFRTEPVDEAPCPRGRETSVILLTFDHPIDVADVRTDETVSGG